VALSDTLIAFLAGLMIFPALFSVGVAPTAGPSLVFEVLPNIFAQMPAGGFVGIAFFVLLAIAALTSTVSLLEVPVAFLVDQKKWSRKKAVIIISTATFVLGLPSALSQGTSEFFSTVTLFGKEGFLSIMSFLFSDISLPAGGLFIALFVGWVWGVDKASREALQNTSPRIATLMKAWSILIRYVCPVVILAILISTMV
jgi:NSS family neurotransmitter:Na+ symporter